VRSAERDDTAFGEPDPPHQPQGDRQRSGLAVDPDRVIHFIDQDAPPPSPPAAAHAVQAALVFTG